MKLFYAKGTCSLAAHIALEDAGAEFEAIPVDLAAGQQRAAQYLEINPKGRVPALVTDRGILTENPAILLYIAMTCPGARLAPLEDPFELARIQSFNAYLSSTVHVAHAHGPRGSRWADEPDSHADMKRKVPETMTACFELIETSLIRGPWVMGDQYTIADPYLFTLASWRKPDGVTKEFPKVDRHTERMLQRESVQTVLAREKRQQP